MSWQAFTKSARDNWIIATVIATAIAFGGWWTYAEMCHAQGREDHKSIEQIQKIIQAQALKAESDAKAEKAKWRFIRQACILKTLNDPEKCAEAEARNG